MRRILVVDDEPHVGLAIRAWLAQRGLWVAIADGGASGLAGGCGGSPSPDGRHLALDDRNQSNNMWMMENF